MTSMRGVVRIGTLALALALTVGHAAAQQPTASGLEDLLARARQSALDLLNKLSNVVAEERYVQDSSSYLRVVPIPGLTRSGPRADLSGRAPSTMAKHRDLKADFLIVKLQGNLWQPFRDVFEVDGIAIRDREQRLAKLFLDKRSESEVRAKEIADESARYNLGSVERTINNPLFPLMYLESADLGYVKFTMGKTERVAGVTLRILDYIEEGRPTRVRGRPGEELPAFGRFWIEEETGRLVKGEVRIERRDVKAHLTTEFRADERLGTSVPAEMRESYELNDSTVRGTATYSRFRRFGVESSEELATPAQDAAPSPP